MSEKLTEEILKDINKNSSVSRRDALKMAMATPLALSIFGAEEAQAMPVSDAKGKIVIVGGGLSGLSTAARLCRRLKNPDVTLIEPNEHSVSYQAGTSLIAADVYTKEDVWYNTKDYMPSEVKWIKRSAANFDPENNTVILDNGERISYDYLIVAMGMTLNYGAVGGLVGQTTTSGDCKEVREKVGKNGVYSLYFIDGSVDARDGIKSIIQRAKKMDKNDPKLELIFSDSPTPIKCGGAPKKIAYIAHDLIKKAGVRDRVNITFYTNSGKLFNVPEYAEAIEKQFKARDIKFFFKTRLVKVDTQNQVATFEKSWIEKGEFDKDLGEYEEIKKTETFEKKFDFLHVVPHQGAPKAVGDSPLGSSTSFVPVDKETLQHVKFKNVFSIGDCAAVPLGKTGGSARKQYKVLVENLVTLMEGGTEFKEKYDGYTVCPLITGVGTVMFAEFDWSGHPAPSFPLDPTQERWTMWILKAYIMKPMVMCGMLSGRI